MKPSEIIAVVFITLIIALVVVVIVGLIVSSSTRRKYKKFVLKHSLALKQLDKINTYFKNEFRDIPNFDMENKYDNEKMFNNISCQDYLTYQLVYLQNQVDTALKDTLFNKGIYEQYEKTVKETCKLNQYDTPDLPKNPTRLFKTERALFNKRNLTPTINFSIYVRLILTNINGVYKTSKRYTFNPKQIKDIIAKLRQKKGNYYTNNDIWQSICRVERGKVTNRMRFAIYEKYHYRCQMCGKYSRYLEIDHIIPIAKGGKSTFDNLQPLCHNCNYKKGDSIDGYSNFN